MRSEVMDASQLLHKLPTAFRAAAAAGKNYVIQWHLSEPAYAVITEGQCHVAAGVAPRHDVALTLSDENFVDLMQGRLGHIDAFLTGRLTVMGDLMLAQRLTNFFDVNILRSLEAAQP